MPRVAGASEAETAGFPGKCDPDVRKNDLLTNSPYFRRHAILDCEIFQRELEMTKILMVCAAAAALTFTAAAPQQAQARDGGAVAAGVLGGLIVGGMIGAAAANQAPPPGYAPQPVYRAPPPRCYMTRGEPVWDDYRGAWVRPRVRVCE
jgi:hypothetical protein